VTTPGEVVRAGRRVASCDVWWSVPTSDPGLLDLLDETERHRAVRLACRKDRDRYVTAHALARLLLAKRSGEAPAQLRFDRTCRRCGAPDHGKPRLIGPVVPFSLAHAGDRVVVAVVGEPTARLEVGVDVERVVGPEVPARLSRDVLAPAELAAYDRLGEHERGHALAVWWTRKESVLKATGDGLAVPPAGVEVTPPWSPPALARPVPRPAGSRRGRRTQVPGPAAVALHELDAGADHVGCLAVLGVQTVRVSERDAGLLLHEAM
jgi:4'-phosphopantetheinyl transferase